MSSEPTREEMREVSRDAARVVKSRLKPDPFEATGGIHVLGKDSFGNYRFKSLGYMEYDVTTKKDVPAEMLITKEGKHLLSTYPSLLRAIQQGDLHPDSIFQTGSSAFVIHDRTFPDLAIKLLTFQPLVVPNDPNQAPENWIPPIVQSATGIDHLHWKQILEKIGVRVPKPYFATRDVMVEQFINGETLFDLLCRAGQEVSSNEQYGELIDLVEYFTQLTYGKVTAAIMNEEGPFKNVTRPQKLDMAPNNKHWAEESKWMHGVAPASFLNNWLVKGNIDLNSFLSLPRNSQLNLLQRDAFLVDPFANREIITEDDENIWLHHIPPYGKEEFKAPTGTWGQEDTERYERATANMKPAFLRQYERMAKMRGIKPIESGNFMRVDGLTVVGPGRQVWTVPENMDPRIYRERYAEVGLYAINGGKVGFVNGKGEKFVGNDTDVNVAALEKAGYKKGWVWVDFSHGEEAKAA